MKCKFIDSIRKFDIDSSGASFRLIQGLYAYDSSYTSRVHTACVHQ
jgi:hypothetical protein